MYRNDAVGDCTCAAVGHLIQAWTRYSSGQTVEISDDDVIAAYAAVSGYDPQTGAHDEGAVMQEVLDYWRKTGIGGHQILAFAEVDLSSQASVDAALNLFGGLYVGAWMPLTAQDQIDAGDPWDVVTSGGSRARPGSWGGHCIHIGRYDDTNDILACTTWGTVQPLTEAWWKTYVDEAWVVITKDWLDANGYNPLGLDLFSLGEEFATITGGQNPFVLPSRIPWWTRLWRFLRNLISI